ncbi:DUF2130 domain-containing protein [Zavarzinia compransoris]|uniref:DUF2130 domain-containing protein n=1 Tax=Zavarzinia compransoris TaxID=1264899 RepID=A0A317DZ28_9PROT|nr:DUF2130 domain-containing protein [Zavarzinia compransoris]PWR19969.1 hypothetical protein DKG75_16115 [Zavarzinia compransoris]
MMANPQTSVASTVRSSPVHHLHPVDDVCPVCEQAIPHDRADEVAERLQAREQAQSATITARLQEKFDTEKTEALERARLEADQKITEAREQARLAAELQSKALVDAAEAARVAAQDALQAKTVEAATEKADADAAKVALQGQLEQVQRESAAAIEKVKADAAAQEDAIRSEAARVATEAAASRLAEVEAQKVIAENAGETLKAELAQARLTSEQALADAQAKAAAREVEVRAEVSAAAEAAAQLQIGAAEQAKADAEARAAAAETTAKSLQESHEAQLNERLQEQREALEADKVAAVNAEKSATFEDRQKLANKVEELQRALEKKTAEELGEGAEINLFEALKAEFDGDRIVRVTKGQQGADILHTVIHSGQECGTIIYDSKNHNAWRNDFVTKLRSDQLSAQADHAVLSSSKFPAGARQLHIQDGVVIACPARVVALIQLVRAHLVQSHTLRTSNAERTQKTAALYSFITSQQCADSFARLDELAESLLDIQTKEVKAHENVWKQQGLAIRAAMKVQAELRNQIDSIIGTASAPESPQ